METSSRSIAIDQATPSSLPSVGSTLGTRQSLLAAYKQRPLRAHDFLAGIPLHSLDYLELPGGDPHMDLAQISREVGFNGIVSTPVGPVTQALFDLRTLIGRVFHWEKAADLIQTHSYVERLTPIDAATSLVPPGQAAGISRILYQFEQEMLAEIINRTVHCFWVMAAEPTPTGYGLWLAVYVRKLNWFTPIYMACISTILKWVIYPSLRKAMGQSWQRSFPNSAAPRPLQSKITFPRNPSS